MYLKSIFTISTFLKALFDSISEELSFNNSLSMSLYTKDTNDILLRVDIRELEHPPFAPMVKM